MDVYSFGNLKKLTRESGGKLLYWYWKIPYICSEKERGGGSKKEGKKSAMGNDNLSTKAEQKLKSLK